MNDLKVIVINCRSIKNTKEQFDSLLDLVTPDVVIGTVSWLDSNITNNDIFLSYYTVYHKERNLRGGGVFIMVHSSLNCSRI